MSAVPAEGPRKPANLSLDPSLMAEARALGINLSRAAETGLRQAVREAQAVRWRRENAEALEDSNAWIEKNGLPLDRYRQF